MDELKLEVARRNILGKKNRILRRQGITPTHLFGRDVESLALQSKTDQLEKIIARAGMTKLITLRVQGDAKPKSVFIREIQREPVSRQLLHIDLYEVKKGEKIRVEVPIILVGEAPALRTKGRMLTHGVTSLSVESVPEKMPSEIQVDVSSLVEVDQTIYIKDIQVSPDVVIHADPGQLVVKISEAVVKEVEVPKAVEEAVVAEAGAEAPSEGAQEGKETKPAAETKTKG